MPFGVAVRLLGRGAKKNFCPALLGQTPRPIPDPAHDAWWLQSAGVRSTRAEGAVWAESQAIEEALTIWQ
jgi:hypothetical protein